MQKTIDIVKPIDNKSGKKFDKNLCNNERKQAGLQNNRAC